MGKLDGRVALISGGSRGQGEAQARLFAGRELRSRWPTCSTLRASSSPRASTTPAATPGYFHLDVSEQSQWAATVDAVVERFGRLDILINNAGIVRSSLIEDSTLQEYLEVIRINQVGVWLGMRAAIKPMKEAGGGCIINTSSTAGLEGYPGLSAYVSSKFAVRGMTKVGAVELGQYGIRVNSVHPDRSTPR